MAGATLKMASRCIAHDGESDKPNEDTWLIRADLGLAMVADGVTRSRRSDGSYPSDISRIAPMLCVDAVSVCFETAVEDADGDPFLRERLSNALERANARIREENRARGILKQRDFWENDYLGTTVCALALAPRGDHFCGTIAFIGDPIAFQIISGGDPELITRDQVAACHAFSYSHWNAKVASGELTAEAAKRERLTFQRSRARNQLDAKDPAGNLIGFGVLTGELGAMSFLEYRLLYARPGDRFILASDALRACSASGAETSDSYRSVFGIMRGVPWNEAPGLLVHEIRKEEHARRLRSDDATVVVVQVE